MIRMFTNAAKMYLKLPKHYFCMIWTNFLYCLGGYWSVLTYIVKVTPPGSCTSRWDCISCERGWHLMHRVILYRRVILYYWVIYRRVENVELSTCRECRIINVLRMSNYLRVENFQKTLENSKSQKKSCMIIENEFCYIFYTWRVKELFFFSDIRLYPNLTFEEPLSSDLVHIMRVIFQTKHLSSYIQIVWVPGKSNCLVCLAIYTIFLIV